MKTITAYRCEHCPRARVMVTLRSMERHEARCISNPASRACPSCAHDLGPGPSNGCSIGAREPQESMVRGCVSWAHCDGDDDGDVATEQEAA